MRTICHLINQFFPFLAQPVVSTTANVIYTIPTNDPGRFPRNYSSSSNGQYDQPPSYDQVVLTPTTPTITATATATTTISRPPSFSQVQHAPSQPNPNK